MLFVTFVVDKVSLLLHLAGCKNLRHQNFNTTSHLKSFIFFLLATLIHFLFGFSIQPAFLINIITLALSQEGFLLNTTKYIYLNT